DAFCRMNDQVTALDVYAGDRARDSDGRALGSAVAASRNAECFKRADIEYDLRRHPRLKPSKAGPLAVDSDYRRVGHVHLYGRAFNQRTDGNRAGVDINRPDQALHFASRRRGDSDRL